MRRSNSNQNRCRTPYQTSGDLTLSSLGIEEADPDRPIPFAGVTGAFLNQMNNYLGYSAPVMSANWKTPSSHLIPNTKIANLWPKVGSLKNNRTSGVPINAGDSLLKSTILTNTLDTGTNSLRMMMDYGQHIISEMTQLDEYYLAMGLYGRPDYLTAVQSPAYSSGYGAARHTGPRATIPVGLLGVGSAAPLSATNPGVRPHSKQPALRTGQYAHGDPSFPQDEVIRLTDAMKGIDYICQITYKESYTLETQYMACGLYHRYLSCCRLRKSEVKLLAAVCIFIATKLEENYGEALGTTAVCAYFAQKFTVRQLLDAEIRFLEIIDWRLGVSFINPRSYLRPIFRDLGLPAEVCLLASYISELSLLDPKFLAYRAYEIALGAVELAVLSQFNTKNLGSTFAVGFQASGGGSLRGSKTTLVEAARKAPLQRAGSLQSHAGFTNVIGRMILVLASETIKDSGAMTAIQKGRSQATKGQSECRNDLLQAWRCSYKEMKSTQIYKKYSEPSYHELAKVIEPFDSVEALIKRVASGELEPAN